MSDTQKKELLILIKVERGVLTVLGTVATLIMFFNAASRYLFKTTFVWAEESIRILFVWTMFIAVTTAFSRNEHIGFDGIAKKKGAPNLIYRIAYALSLIAVGAILCIYGFKYNTFTGGVPLTGTGLPTAVLMWPGILAGAAWTVLGILKLVKIFTGAKGENSK
ncbi:MAG TPA: TRAP transporter small permease subunit [Rectinemataceae bacterium]|nr:TRAP transporter small permease subunit [Rectinemataceae bacterium]